MNEMYANLFKLDELSDIIDSGLIDEVEEGDVIHAGDFPDMLFQVSDFTDDRDELDDTDDSEQTLAHKEGNKWVLNECPTAMSQFQYMIDFAKPDNWKTISEDSRKDFLAFIYRSLDFDMTKFRMFLMPLFYDIPGIPFDPKQKYAVGDIVLFPFDDYRFKFRDIPPDWANIKFGPYALHAVMYIGDEYAENK